MGADVPKKQAYPIGRSAPERTMSEAFDCGQPRRRSAAAPA